MRNPSGDPWLKSRRKQIPALRAYQGVSKPGGLIWQGEIIRDAVKALPFEGGSFGPSDLEKLLFSL
jgi:hypothetical protein